MEADLDACAIAARFALGDDARIDGPPAHGELGAVWPLRTDRGRWAVKRGTERQDVAEAETTTRVQEEARANGVLAPAAIRTVGGELLADVAGSQVRVHEWFDLAPMSRTLDVTGLGVLLARMHTATGGAARPADPWFGEPITAAQWDELLVATSAAPFHGSLTAHRDELVPAPAASGSTRRRPRPSVPSASSTSATGSATRAPVR